MPFCGYCRESGEIVEVVEGAKDVLTLEHKMVVPSGVQSIAVTGNGAIYYLPMKSPKVLIRRDMGSGADEIVEGLAYHHKQVFHHRNKIFCVSVSGFDVEVYDPLCATAEVLTLSCSIAHAVAADNGFVFLSECNRVFGYSWSGGLTEVKGGGAITDLLGQWRHYAVAVLNDGVDRLVGVTEAGSLVELSVSLPHAPFACLDDLVLHSEGAEVVSSRGNRVRSQWGELRLTSAHPLDDEVLCSICLCTFDDGGDGITLDCGHYFHKDCIEQWVSSWMEFAAKGEHIIFTRAVCPGGCKCTIRHPLLSQSKQIGELSADVAAKKALLLAHCDGPQTEDDFLFYLCGLCGQAFYGGERVCSRMQGHEPSSPPQDLVCDACLARSHQTCGNLMPVFKCHYCCNPATQRSFGTRYLCERCNARWDTVEPAVIPCPGRKLCPFEGAHPGPGSQGVVCLFCVNPAVRENLFGRVVAKDGSHQKMIQG